MKSNNWPVCDEGIRPAGKPDKCFYCSQPKGTQHANGCVIRSRTVVIRTIVTHTVDVPESFNAELIEFTGGSACSNRHIQDLMKLVDRLGTETDHSCTCSMLEIEYVREATPEDEEESRIYVEQLPR